MNEAFNPNRLQVISHIEFGPLPTLTEFLLARVAEDEAAARACPAGVDVSDWSDAATEHLLAWSPERVLAECEAKRRIIEDYAAHPQPNLYLALARLAAVYASHPAYRQEWMP